MTVSLGTRALQAMSGGLIALLVVVGVVAPMASAYARQSDPASAAVGPIVGERVRISDSNGEEAAAVSVSRLEDPYELELAEPGFRYVLAEVVVEYTGDDVIEVEANNFTMLDTQGFTYDAETAFLHRLDGPEDGGEAPGQAWGTGLLFQLPVDAVLAQDRSICHPLSICAPSALPTVTSSRSPGRIAPKSRRSRFSRRPIPTKFGGRDRHHPGERATSSTRSR